jgi:hypothetical protein
VLELRRGREDDVGVGGRVRQELLEDDGEEVLAGEALEDLALLRCDGCGVRAPDDEGGDRRIEPRIRQSRGPAATC